VNANIPVTADVDVLVVGGGTAGSVAGIAAARNGVKTLVIEQLGFLGGTTTGGLVFPMMLNHVNSQPLNTGISSEIQGKLASMGEGGQNSWGSESWFNPEALKIVLEEMALTSGCGLLYHIFATKPIMEGNTVKGVMIESKSGRSAIMSRITIDATGDADISFRAGVPCESGRSDGVSQPMSLRFFVGNVDLERLRRFIKGKDPQGEYGRPGLEFWMVPGRDHPLEETFRKAVREGILQEEDTAYFQAFEIPGRPGEIGFNCPRIMGNLKGFDPSHLTQAQIQGRERIARLVRFMRRYLEGFEEAYLSQVAPMIGVRESRRIKGEYVLTADDYFRARKFDDAIARNRYPIDIHLPMPMLAGQRELRPDEYHEIPYRCLVPQIIDGLLVSGRCLSATFEAQAAVRIIPNMRAVGEAAGTAASLCVRLGIMPRKLDGKKLREALRNQGANL